MSLALSSPYKPLQTLMLPEDGVVGVNCMSFSPDGRLLASGDSCSIRIWDVKSGSMRYGRKAKNGVQCLVWHTSLPLTVVYGTLDGEAVLLSDFLAKKTSVSRSIRTGVQLCVYALQVDSDGGRIAIGVGEEVRVATILDDSYSYATTHILPRPPALPGRHSSDGSPVCARSMHFAKGGLRLIVGYLYHGVICWDLQSDVCLWQITPTHSNQLIGAMDVCLRTRTVALTNLTDGVDIYAMGGSKPLKSLPTNIADERNVILSVSFLRHGRLVVSGATDGRVTVWEVTTGEPQQVLNHAADGPLIQAVCAHDGRRSSLIATSTSETGTRTRIRIWKAQNDYNRLEQGWNDFVEAAGMSREEFTMALTALAVASVAYWLFKSESFYQYVIIAGSTIVDWGYSFSATVVDVAHVWWTRLLGALAYLAHPVKSYLRGLVLDLLDLHVGEASHQPPTLSGAPSTDGTCSTDRAFTGSLL